jgi:F0F1-type ATP synthase assembly protein I
MPDREPPGLWRLIRLGTTMAGLIAGGVLIGWFVDTRAHTLPAFTFAGLAVGMAATCWYGYATFRRFL